MLWWLTQARLEEISTAYQIWEEGKRDCVPLYSGKIPRKVSEIPPSLEGRAAWSGEQQLGGQAQLAGHLALLGNKYFLDL